MSLSIFSNARISWPLSSHTQTNYVFLFSHMRSYSSLLAHILGSSPEIDGYGEAHVHYRDVRSFGSLKRRVKRSIGHEPRGKWQLDKILHNCIQPPDLLLNKVQMRSIIFIRKPEATLRSMLTSAIVLNADARSRDPQFACDYYVSRLHRLRFDGERLGKDALYFQSETFIHSPQSFLGALGQWLELETPLDTQYQVQSRTGELGFGDPSPNIRKGKVLGPEASTILSDVVIPPVVLKEAEAAYNRCHDTLQRCCETISNQALQ